MNCPSCNDTVPENSKFCFNCGTVFKADVVQSGPINTKTAVEIAQVAIWFDDGVEKVTGFLQGANTIKRNWIMAVQLLDENGESTANEGVFSFNIHFSQSIEAGEEKILTVTQKRYESISDNKNNGQFKVGVQDFYRSANYQGKIFCKYKNPAPVKIDSRYSVFAQIGITFTPTRQGKKLEKNYSCSLDAV